MEIKNAELFIKEDNVLGEGPHWDSKSKILYWVDILGKKVFEYDYSSKEIKRYNFDRYVSAVIKSSLGYLILAMQGGLYRYDTEANTLENITIIERDKISNRLNDGKSDKSGRIWIGSMSMEGQRDSGTLYSYHSEEGLIEKVKNVTISNGLCWNTKRKKMYFIDTPTQEVISFDFNLENGFIKNREKVIRISEKEGNPDGMTIDSEGMVWIAHWGGGKVTRWDPEIGKQLCEINVPAKNVTSCTFGGENLQDLFITTAKEGLTNEEKELYPLSGSVFKVSLEIKGTEDSKYLEK